MNFQSVIDGESCLDEICELIDIHGFADIMKYYVVLMSVGHCLKRFDVSRRAYWIERRG